MVEKMTIDKVEQGLQQQNSLISLTSGAQGSHKCLGEAEWHHLWRRQLGPSIEQHPEIHVDNPAADGVEQNVVQMAVAQAQKVAQHAHGRGGGGKRGAAAVPVCRARGTRHQRIRDQRPRRRGRQVVEHLLQRG